MIPVSLTRSIETWQVTGDTNFFDNVYKHYFPKIKYMASKYKHLGDIESENLLSDLSYAFYRASVGFDPSRDIQFSTYFYAAAKATIRTFLTVYHREIVTIPLSKLLQDRERDETDIEEFVLYPEDLTVAIHAERIIQKVSDKLNLNLVQRRIIQMVVNEYPFTYISRVLHDEYDILTSDFVHDLDNVLDLEAFKNYNKISKFIRNIRLKLRSEF